MLSTVAKKIIAVNRNVGIRGASIDLAFRFACTGQYHFWLNRVLWLGVPPCHSSTSESHVMARRPSHPMQCFGPRRVPPFSSGVRRGHNQVLLAVWKTLSPLILSSRLYYTSTTSIWLISWTLCDLNWTHLQGGDDKREFQPSWHTFPVACLEFGGRSSLVRFRDKWSNAWVHQHKLSDITEKKRPP